MEGGTTSEGTPNCHSGDLRKRNCHYITNSQTFMKGQLFYFELVIGNRKSCSPYCNQTLGKVWTTAWHLELTSKSDKQSTFFQVGAEIQNLGESHPEIRFFTLQGLFQALMFTTAFAQKIEFYGYCLFWLVTLKAPSR